MDKKVVGEVVDEAAGEGGFGDEDKGFHEDEFDTEEFGDDKERKGDAGAGRKKKVGFFVIKDLDGQDEVFKEVD